MIRAFFLLAGIVLIGVGLHSGNPAAVLFGTVAAVGAALSMRAHGGKS